jgi:hypothetical protein
MIDPIVTTLINFGIGGCMAALVVWHVWYTQTKQIPALLATFESQMGKEREAANSRMATEREISTIRHEDNIRQYTLLLTSVRGIHHAHRNQTNTLALLAAKIDFMLGLKTKEETRLREEDLRKEAVHDKDDQDDDEMMEVHSAQGS